jgi:hypothetical protein
MYKPTEDKLEYVYEQICVLNWMKGFPKEEKQLRFISKIVAGWAARKPKKHPVLCPDGSEIAPLEWLMAEIGSTQEFFPPPIVMRQIYETQWTPLDGKQSPDILAAIDGSGNAA